MKVLVSAFTPFHKREINASSEVLKLLPEAFEKIILETSYEKSYKALGLKFDDYRPDVLIMLGESSKCDEVVVEKIALNYAHAEIADNDDDLKRNEPIVSSLPLAIETKVDLCALEKISRISYHAGTYVCNYLYFKMLLHTQKTSCKTLFIHIPVNMEISLSSKKVIEVIQAI